MRGIVVTAKKANEQSGRKRHKRSKRGGERKKGKRKQAGKRKPKRRRIKKVLVLRSVLPPFLWTAVRPVCTSARHAYTHTRCLCRYTVLYVCVSAVSGLDLGFSRNVNGTWTGLESQEPEMNMNMNMNTLVCEVVCRLSFVISFVWYRSVWRESGAVEGPRGVLPWDECWPCDEWWRGGGKMVEEGREKESVE